MAHVLRFFSWPWRVRLRGLPPWRSDVVGALDQHAPGPGRRIADAHPLGRRQQLDDELDDHPRRVELTTLLAGVIGELFDQVLVGAAEQVGLGHAVVAQRDLGEVLDEPREHGVAVLRVAEPPLVVVVDAGEDAFQRGVLLLQRRARLVERLADVRGPLLDGAPPRPVRYEELVLVGVGPRDVLGHAVGDQLLGLLLEPVREPFQEEQAEDVGLVVAAVDRPAQDVGRGPEVMLELGDAQRLSRRVGSFDHRRRCRGRTSAASTLRSRAWSEEAHGKISLPPAGIIEVERSAQLLQAAAGQIRQDLIESGLPGSC